MAVTICPTCNRSRNDLEQRDETSQSREVSLSHLQDSSTSCRICGFVHSLLEHDLTTPKLDNPAYLTDKVRVENGGLKFTGQWQGALVTEIYKAGNYVPRPISRCCGYAQLILNIGGSPKLPEPKDIPVELASDLAASLIKNWINECQEHPGCNYQPSENKPREDFRRNLLDTDLPKGSSG